MSENGQTEKRTLQPLRGERPPNVEGRMRRRRLIDKLDEWAEEDKEIDKQEEKEMWETVKSCFRHPPSD
jgi:hypothetical protein